MPSLYKNLRTGKGEPLFQHPAGGTILSNFSDVLHTVSLLPIQTDTDEILSIHMPKFRHNGRNENVIVTARNLNIGKPDKPNLLILPPYPLSTRLTKTLFVGKTYSDWNQEGISPFESKDSMPAPFRSILGAIYAYAGGIRMLHERIKDTHDKGQKVGVFGFSYGANVISAYLTYINSLPEDERSKSRPDKVFVVEGGKIFELTLRSTFGKRADPNTIAAVNANNNIWPTQTHLSPDVAQDTFAVINNEDLSVLGQSETWKGAKQFEVKGTHVRAPIRNLLQIRKLLRTHFQTLLNA